MCFLNSSFWPLHGSSCSMEALLFSLLMNIWVVSCNIRWEHHHLHMVNDCRLFSIKTGSSGSHSLFSDLPCNSDESMKRWYYSTSVVASVPENVPFPSTECQTLGLSNVRNCHHLCGRRTNLSKCGGWSWGRFQYSLDGRRQAEV